MHEGDEQRAVERARLVLDLLGIARDRDQIAAVLAEIDGALEHAQPLVLGAARIAAPGAVGLAVASSSRSCGRPVSHSERDERISGLASAERRDLPVPARQRQLEQRLAERRARRGRRIARARRRRRPACAGRRRAGGRRSAPPRRDRSRTGSTPVATRMTTVHGGRRQEQAQRERVSAHRPAASGDSRGRARSG